MSNKKFVTWNEIGRTMGSGRGCHGGADPEEIVDNMLYKAGYDKDADGEWVKTRYTFEDLFDFLSSLWGFLFFNFTLVIIILLWYALT